MLFDRLSLDKLGLDRFSREDLEEALVRSTTLLAVVGAGDLAVERLRAARGELGDRAAAFDPQVFREQAQASLADGIDALQAEVMAAPDQLRALPEKAQEWPTRAQSLLADLVSAAFSMYGDLAGRGKTVVTQARASHLVEVDIEEEVLPVSRPVTPVRRPVPAPVQPPVSKPVSKRAAKPVSEQAPKAKRAPAAAPDTAKTVAAKTTASKSIATKPKPSKSAAKKTSPAKKSATTPTPSASGAADTSR